MTERIVGGRRPSAQFPSRAGRNGAGCEAVSAAEVSGDVVNSAGLEDGFAAAAAEEVVCVLLLDPVFEWHVEGCMDE